MARVEAAYVTDPADPWSWAAEPAMRRLAVEFGDEVAVTYVMGGFARQVADGATVARAVLDAAASAGMPADPRPWLNGHPASSYPACLAVKAAAEQGLDAVVLRVLREGFMVDRRRQDTADALLDAVRAVDGLDRGRDLPGPRAPAELWRLALEWRVRAERVLGGEMWSAA